MSDYIQFLSVKTKKKSPLLFTIRQKKIRVGFSLKYWCF
ncbi:hypothetical protein SPONN_1950 [uncultured Candidatus Thioglobus sp.]|nr:hypothetical protein SPONN_1950 [uncultured Candidatus Thioglobus sp.]